MKPSGPRWALSVNIDIWLLTYSNAFPSFDSSAVRDHFRVAVAIKAHKTDLSYPAVGLSDRLRWNGGLCYLLLPASGGHHIGLSSGVCNTCL